MKNSNNINSNITANQNNGIHKIEWEQFHFLDSLIAMPFSNKKQVPVYGMTCNTNLNRCSAR